MSCSRCATSAALRCVRGHARCAPARSSAWPASLVRPHGTRAHPVRPHARRQWRNPLDETAHDPQPARRHRPRHRLRAGRSPPPRRRPRPAHRAQHHDGHPPDALSRKLAALRRRDRARAAAHPRPWHQSLRPRRARRLAQRRQSAKSQRRPLARHETAPAHSRRADARRGRGREGRDPQDHPRPRKGRPRCADDLERSAGSPRHERPHRRHARRPADRDPARQIRRPRCYGRRARAGEEAAIEPLLPRILVAGALALLCSRSRFAPHFFSSSRCFRGSPRRRPRSSRPSA